MMSELATRVPADHAEVDDALAQVEDRLPLGSRFGQVTPYDGGARDAAVTSFGMTLRVPAPPAVVVDPARIGYDHDAT